MLANPNHLENAREGLVMPRISWSGILTGVIAGLIIQIALVVLGLAIGFVSIENLNNLGAIAITAGIWMAISWAIAAFVGGLTAARAAGYLTPAQGRFNGLITGMLMLIISTLFMAGVISSAVSSATGTVKDIAGAAAGAVGQAANATGGAVASNGGLAGTLQSLGLGDAYQAVTSGLDDTELNQIIADASPELNQTQVAATTGLIRGIIKNSSRDLGTALQNPSDLPNFVSTRVTAIGKALSGNQFVTRLRQRGLSQVQATEVETVISKRVKELAAQGEQAAKAASEQAQQLARDAANTAGKAAWVWLLLAGLVLGLASFGGGYGNDANTDGRMVDETGRMGHTSST